MNEYRITLPWISLLLCLGAGPDATVDRGLTDSAVLRDALIAELDRSMEGLAVEGLPRPYFIQYVAQDWVTCYLSAAYGGLTEVSEARSRSVVSRVRVGSYELDNTNMGRSRGVSGALPLDDDVTALRQAIWRITDADYKQAVQGLANKRTYLEDKTINDRPDDFTRAEPVVAIEPCAQLDLDVNQWRARIAALSARFCARSAIQDAWVALTAGAANQWCVNSEGTRIRMKGTGVELNIYAQLQAPDGMYVVDTLTYLALQPDQFPPMERVLTDIDALCGRLVALGEAPVLEHYEGPVLFEPAAAGKVFEALLADGLCARPAPLGQGWANETMEKKIGRRILPRSFQVYDDPRSEWLDDTLLAGSYTFDDDGIRPTRVSLVEDGVLKTLLAGRAPTRKITRSTGHGRGGGYGDSKATIGCLYISDDDGVSGETLVQELIEAAREEGLEFAIRIASMESGMGYLGDPILAYKVYVDDGREELVRGLEFQPVELRALKRILAAGTDRTVYNNTAGATTSIIAPAILFEELELVKIEGEFDKLPILPSPWQRTPPPPTGD